MKEAKAEQTVNSEEMPVARAGGAESREWARMTGGQPTAVVWVYNTGSSECLLLKQECCDFFFIII